MAIGNPISLTDNVASKSVAIVATADQTSFTPSGGYRINELAVYRNGVRLVDGKDFLARDGVTVTLTNGCTVDDVVEFQIFDDFKVSGAINQNDSEQTIDGNLNIVGILSATTLTGAGGDITGISTGVSINAAGGALQRVMLGNQTSGLANTMANTADLYYNNTTSTLYAPNVNVSGTMTQEDVQNVDSTGIVTGGLGLRATKGGVEITAGVSTFKANVVFVGDVNQINSSGIISATGLDISTAGVDIDGLTNLDETVVAGACTITGVTSTSVFHAKDARWRSVSEKSTLVSGNLATLSFATDSNIAVFTAPTGALTISLNDIPVDETFNNQNITVSAVIANPGTSYSCTTFKMNGVTKTVKYAGGSIGEAISGLDTSLGYTVQTFTGINTVGSAASAANYTVFSVFSGGFF